MTETIEGQASIDGDLFALDAIVQRGHSEVLWDIPENETGPIPESVEDWVGPIASESVVDPQAAKTLTSRSDVRR